MRTIELDTSNPMAFENYVSIKERNNEKLFLSIIAISVLSYFIYESYQEYVNRKK
jgi:hypothetical protein